MGIDLSSLSSGLPQFSSKALFTSAGNTANDQLGSLTFDSHDEGLDSTTGHIANAENLLHSNQAKYNDQHELDVFAELDHRSPYHHMSGVAQDGSMQGYVRKQTNRNSDIFSSWNERNAKGPVTFKDSMGEARSEFGEYNRNRQGPNAHVSKMIDRVINTNEMSPHGSRLLRSYPHYFSSQFLNVHNLGDAGSVTDQVDLKTGTWAKIDPEGYFPD